MKRRKFIRNIAGAASLASLSATAARRVLGSNERIRLGWIGCGGRGRFVAGHMRTVPNVEFVAVCDVYEQNRLAAQASVGSQCEAYQDFRRVLDRADVDAVLIATPDHWHAIPTVLACEAGKDVYVEKPLGHNVREGQAMLRAARQHDRIVQTGTQQRSAPHFEVMRDIVQNGQLGKVHFVRIWNYRNVFPEGIGRRPDGPAPKGLDWDFYLGPAPAVPFNANRFLNRYRYFFDYSGGIITDWGTHRIDSMHQVMGESWPRRISAMGGRYELDDGGDVPDTMQVSFEYPDFLVSYEASMLNAHGCGGRTPGRSYYNANNTDDRPNGLAFYGTNGALFADRLGFEIYPELKPGVTVHRRRPEAITPDLFRTVKQDGFSPDSTYLHTSDFIDSIRSRTLPKADIALGHQASTVAHLGNISLRVGAAIRWDANQGEILDNPAASALLGRQARPPWDLI